MTTDEIVEEIHRIRQQMLQEHGGDLGKLVESLKRSEQEHPERLAPPAPPSKWKLPEEQKRG